MIVLDAYGNVAPFMVPAGGYAMLPVDLFLVEDGQGGIEIVARQRPEPLASTPWGVQAELQQRRGA